MAQMENFSYLFNNINNFISNHNYDDLKQYKNSEKHTSRFRKYNQMFVCNDHNEKIGLKTNIFINSTHYDDKNIWLLKAPDLNRGRCIRIVNNIQEIAKLIK